MCKTASSEVAGEGLVLLVLISLAAELPGLCRGQYLDTQNRSGVVRKNRHFGLSVVVVGGHYLADFSAFHVTAGTIASMGT